MSVYVDDRQEVNPDVGGFDRWSRLMADNESELHAFAERIGLHESLVNEDEDGGKYYSVNEQYRRAAVGEGALEVSAEQNYNTAEKDMLLVCDNCGESMEVSNANQHDLRFAHRRSEHRNEGTVNFRIMPLESEAASDAAEETPEESSGNVQSASVEE